MAGFDTLLLFFPGTLGVYDREVRFYGHVFVGLPLLMLGFFLMAPMFVWAVEKLALTSASGSGGGRSLPTSAGRRC